LGETPHESNICFIFCFWNEVATWAHASSQQLMRLTTMKKRLQVETIVAATDAHQLPHDHDSPTSVGGLSNGFSAQ
jgi:hypothetical protein